MNNAHSLPPPAPALEATAAPDVDEIEDARHQGRKQERIATQEEGDQNENSTSIVNTPATDVNDIEAAHQMGSEEEQDTTKQERMKTCIIVFVRSAIASGLITWLLVSWRFRNAENWARTRTFDPPTAEDCLAIYRGGKTEGQIGTTAKAFGVETEFTMAPNLNLELLQAELQLKIQLDVLPILAGCEIEGSVSIENNIFAVENAVLNSVSIGDPGTCSSTTEKLCSSVYFQLDLFSKNDNVPSEVLLGLTTDVFQHEGLLELLELLFPVDDIEFTAAFEILAFGLPTSSPSIQHDGTVPGDDD